MKPKSAFEVYRDYLDFAGKIEKLYIMTKRVCAQ
jgi:hypothetical protein